MSELTTTAVVTAKTLLLNMAKALAEAVWHAIEFDEGGIELQVKRPSLAEQLRALDETQDSTVHEFRIRSMITDWRGVHDEAGNPVPYSWEALSALCTHYPSALFEILALLKRVKTGTSSEPENSLKNSELPSADGGTATTTETTVTTDSSTTSLPSDESIVSERQPD